MINQNGLVQINVPLKCPDCDGRMYSFADLNNGVLNIRRRTFICCHDCDYEIDAERFKDGLLTI